MRASIIAFSLLSTLVSGLAVPEVIARQAETLQPSLAVNVDQSSPDKASGPVTTGRVSRTNGQKDVQMLLSFELEARPGKTCAFAFSGPTKLEGSKRMKISGVDGTIAKDNTFDSRPTKGDSLCVMTVAEQGPATQDGAKCTFPCPDSKTVMGVMVEAADDNVEITWNIGNGGLTIQPN